MALKNLCLYFPRANTRPTSYFPRYTDTLRDRSWRLRPSLLRDCLPFAITRAPESYSVHFSDMESREWRNNRACPVRVVLIVLACSCRISAAPVASLGWSLFAIVWRRIHCLYISPWAMLLFILIWMWFGSWELLLLVRGILADICLEF